MDARQAEEATEAVRVDAGDLVATARADVTLAQLDDALAKHSMWVALDPPGSRKQTLGEVLAAGSGGPLCAGFGLPRDQVLGLSFVARTGTAAKTGGRVVKNVAGFDIAKLLIGSHGAFATITDAHLRLRVRPAADATGVIQGSRGLVAGHAARLMLGGASPVAFEVISPAVAGAMGLEERWSLLLRAMGSAAAVKEELAACGAITSVVAWERWHAAMDAWPVVLRAGCDPASWDRVLDAAETVAGTPAGVSVCVPRGFLRIGVESIDARTVDRLRQVLGGMRHPVSLEKCDEATQRAAGIWGVMDEGALAITRRLLDVYDPHRVAGVPLFAA